MTDSPLAAAWAAAWLEGLRRVAPADEPRRIVRLDDTGRAPNVPLRPAERPDDA